MSESKLSKILISTYRQYHKPQNIGLDPLIVVREYLNNPQIEAIALLASCISYGRVETIITSINKLLTLIGIDITKFIFETSLKDKQERFAGFKHRFNDSTDIAILLEVVKKTLIKFNSLENAFLNGLDKKDTVITHALDNFTKLLKKQAEISFGSRRKSFEYLLPSPSSGSSCKRMNMFLRWMIRNNDGIDLGLWNKKISPSLLVIPVDAHVAKAAKKLSLTTKNTVSWNMALEITNNLKNICPEDPIKFDFSLCHAGMINYRNI